jgi:hypothetical protein
VTPAENKPDDRPSAMSIRQNGHVRYQLTDHHHQSINQLNQLQA